jgi:hypothetical protein
MSDGTVHGGAVNHGARGKTGPSGMPGAPGVTGGTRRGWIVVLICGVLPAALLAAIVAVPAALWSRLPARVADHWTLTGVANGTAPRLVSFAALGLIALLGAGLGWLGLVSARKRASRPGYGYGDGGSPAARRRKATSGAAGLISTGLFLMAVSAASVVLVAVANLGGGGSRSASVSAASPVAIVGGPVLLVAFASYALHRYGGLGGPDDGSPRSTLGLRAGERAVWTGRARARWAWPAAVLLVAGGALAGTVAARWGVAVPLLAAGVLMLGFTAVRVTVAARGVTVGYGPLGLRLTRIPLRRIASAAAVERTGLSFGYRGGLLVLGAAAVAVRRGPALRLTLRDGKTFLVTVDDAATGAALLNDLVHRGTGISGL